MRDKWLAADYGRRFSPADAVRYSDQRKEIDSEIDALSAAVLARELSIERFMVIHYVRGDGRETRLQVLSFDIHRRNFAAGWTWEFNGRGLRKDGTLGVRGEGFTLFDGVLRRRMLTGDWTTIIEAKQHALAS
jgi:hypothetical protein